MAVANFSFKQKVNYTFCNNAVNSYIDHILVPDYLLDSIVMNCKILTEDIDNLSDHLAVSIMMDIPVYKRQCSDVKSASGQGRIYKGVRLRPRWNDPRYQNSYSEELCNILEDVCIPDQINKWSSLGRPRTGEVYNCYREANKAYKKTCKKAVNSKTHERFQFIEKLSKF